MKKIVSLLLSLLIAVAAFPLSISAEAAPIPAFPGAEGAGMYITGGRGGTVYEVTSLEDYKSSTKEKPIPGTLRYGLSTIEKNKNKVTTIVFRVSGTIHLKEKIKTDVYNLTIAGQTAPGDGIAIGDYSVSLGGENIVVRYIRFRGGFAELDDTFSPNGRKMVIDHCSFSWSTDEVVSTKDKSSITVQWSIISNALNMSIHDKGAHGYGGIWGGTNMTFHHNLIANNNSRNPRLDRDFRLEKDGPLLFDLRNNVFYNWGANSGYGGENATGVNIVNNYYKAGPATFDGVKNRIFNPSSEQPGSYYVKGNYVAGYPEITEDNWAGGIQPDYGLSSVNRLDQEVAITYKHTDNVTYTTPVHTDSAADAYEKVLEAAGTVLPKRDSLDARIVNDVRYGLGKFANTPSGDGYFPELAQVTLPADYDTDHDGMPDSWESSHGLNPANASDGNADSGDGYTNLEKYMNSIVSNGSVNPKVTITSPVPNAMIESNQDVIIQADANDIDGTIARVEFSYYDTKAMKLNPLGTVTSAPYTYTWKNAPQGTYYLYAKATDNTGTQTLSSMIIIHVNDAGSIGDWTSQDIGVVSIPGTASSADDTFIVKGSGEIAASDDGIHSADAFNYVHKEVSGDAELISTLSFQNPSEYDNDVKAGLMVRQDLSTDSPFAMIAIMKEEYYGTRVHFMTRSAKGELTVSAIKPDVALPALLKVTKYGNEVRGYISTDGGAYWELVGSAALELPDRVYMGLALDATKSTNNFNYYNTTIFEHTKLLSVPSLTINNPSFDTVRLPEYTVTGTTGGGRLTIKKNGITVVNAIPYEAGTGFSHKVTLTEGVNDLEVSIENAAGLTSTRKLTVTFDKEWTGNVFNVGNVKLTNTSEATISSLGPLQDVAVSAVFTNNSEIEKNGILVLALYDADHKIVSYSYSEESIAALGTQTLATTFKMPLNTAGYKVSAFVWDGLSSKKVISNVVALP